MKKTSRIGLLKLSFSTLAISVMTCLCVVWFWKPGTMLKQSNQGHRLGGDIITRFPENTLPLFRCAICELESNAGYFYSECDLRETKDGEIVIFHDWDLSRLVPDTKHNRAAIKTDHVGSQAIKDLTLAEIKSLRLHGDVEIPTLEEVLQCAVELQLKKPLILEVKYFHSDLGRQGAIDLAKKYRDESQLTIHFSSFRRNIHRSFPNPPQWLEKFASAGFCVYQVYRPKTDNYNLCKTW